MASNRYLAAGSCKQIRFGLRTFSYNSRGIRQTELTQFAFARHQYLFYRRDDGVVFCGIDCLEDVSCSMQVVSLQCDIAA